MKRIACMLLTFGLLLSGCSAGAQREEARLVFTDDLGREVRLDAEPKRVACLLGSFAEIWYLAGGEVIAAPEDAWEDFELPLSEDAVTLGTGKRPSMELLLAAEPDFIIASTNIQQQMQLQDTLEATGIPTAYFGVSDFGDYLRMLKLCTDITGRADLYEQNGTAVQAQIDEALACAADKIGETGEAPTVLCMRLSASGVRIKNSQDNVLGEMLASLGCVNIADSDEVPLENIGMEHILLSDPDYIFMVQMGDDTEGAQEALEAFIRDNPGWQTLTAVREGRVFTMDKRRYNLKPNALWGEAYGDLVELIWP